MPLYTLLTEETELIKALEETALDKNVLVDKALELSLLAVANTTLYSVPVVEELEPESSEEAAVTVTAQVALAEPHVAVMVALPAALAVTLPLLTVATEELDVDHVTVPEAVAVNVEVSPTVKDKDDLFKETESVVVEPEELLEVVLLVAQFHFEEPQQQFAKSG